MLVAADAAQDFCFLQKPCHCNPDLPGHAVGRHRYLPAVPAVRAGAWDVRSRLCPCGGGGRYAIRLVRGAATDRLGTQSLRRRGTGRTWPGRSRGPRRGYWRESCARCARGLATSKWHPAHRLSPVLIALAGSTGSRRPELTSPRTWVADRCSMDRPDRSSPAAPGVKPRC